MPQGNNEEQEWLKEAIQRGRETVAKEEARAAQEAKVARTIEYIILFILLLCLLALAIVQP